MYKSIFLQNKSNLYKSHGLFRAFSSRFLFISCYNCSFIVNKSFVTNRLLLFMHVVRSGYCKVSHAYDVKSDAYISRIRQKVFHYRQVEYLSEVRRLIS